MPNKFTTIPRILVGALLLAATAAGLLAQTSPDSGQQAPARPLQPAPDAPETGQRRPAPSLVDQPTPVPATIPAPVILKLAYQDVVHPDEDLLLPQQPDPSSALPPAYTPPAISQPQEDADLPTRLPPPACAS